MSSYAQMLGALLVLAAFTLTQRGVLEPSSLIALLLNATGAATLTLVAWNGSQWGFFGLNIVWFIVAAAGLITKLRQGNEPATTSPVP